MARTEAAEIARDCLASRARWLERVLTRIYDKAVREHGVTAAQLGMLVAIELAGPTTAAWVGRRLELEKSTVSRNLARLEAAGLVETAPRLKVTPRGSALIRVCHPLWRKAQEQAATAIGAHATRLLSAMPGSSAISRSRKEADHDPVHDP
jgi:DNA-binding MarR family transcriptional regulator